MSLDSDPRDTVLALFAEHGSAVYRFALVLLRHREDAEDVVQETFVRLLEHLRAGRDATNLRGWLFTVAANGCRDRMRRRSRWTAWTSGNDPAVDPPALRDEDGRLSAARRALSRLPRRDRLLVVLRAQGLSYREIAEAARVRPASVGRLLARALERWQRAYGAAPMTTRPEGRAYTS